MSNLTCEGLERLAHETAMQMYIASVAEAAHADGAAPREDLVHDAAIYRARAEGMQAAAEMLLSQSDLQHFQGLMQAVIREEELQFERDLNSGWQPEHRQHEPVGCNVCLICDVWRDSVTH